MSELRRTCAPYPGRLIAGASVALALACSSAPPPAPERPKTTVSEREPAAIDRGAASYETEIGGLNQDDVNEHFAALQPRVEDCVRRASSRVDEVGGRVAVRMRLDRRGHVRWAYLSDSTLGDRGAERCVLDLVSSRGWPKPLSGEGLAESSFEVEPAAAPSDLPARQRKALEKQARIAARSCLQGVKGRFEATAYVGGSGKVLAAGVAPPDERGESVSDCVADALVGLKVGRLPASARPTAKVSFRVR
ncbi:MAG: hypothetical protein R3B13_25275 [Polyangiaceae bacterium]